MNESFKNSNQEPPGTEKDTIAAPCCFPKLEVFSLGILILIDDDENTLKVPLPDAPSLSSLKIYTTTKSTKDTKKSDIGREITPSSKLRFLKFKNKNNLDQYPELKTFSTNCMIPTDQKISGNVMTSCTFSGQSVNTSLFLQSPELKNVEFTWQITKKPQFWYEELKNEPKNSLGENTIIGKVPNIPQTTQNTVLPIRKDGFSSLERLTIRLHKCYRIPFIFDKFPALKHLKLLGKFKFLFISSKDQKKFESLVSRLHSLILKSSNMASIKTLSLPSERFESVLDTFDIINCRYRKYPCFENYPNLLKFSSTQNNLNKIPVNICSLTKLRFLNLSGNKIKEIPLSVFSLAQLSHLAISGNQIANVPTEMALLKNLTHLDLSSNQISEIPNINELQKLTFFRFSGNNLTSQVFTKISKLSDLTVIVLGNNKLHLLPFKLNLLYPNLVKIDVQGNLINHIPSRLFLCPDIRHVDISVNFLSKIPETLGLAAKLEYFKAERNKIGNIPLNIGMLSQLRTFKVGFNSITRLPVTITQCTLLETLDVSNNKIECLPRDIGNLVNLEHFILSCNRLTSLPESFSRLTKLNQLSNKRGYFVQTTTFSFGGGWNGNVQSDSESDGEEESTSDDAPNISENLSISLSKQQQPKGNDNINKSSGPVSRSDSVSSNSSSKSKTVEFDTMSPPKPSKNKVSSNYRQSMPLLKKSRIPKSESMPMIQIKGSELFHANSQKSIKKNKKGHSSREGHSHRGKKKSRNRSSVKRLERDGNSLRNLTSY